MAAPRTRFLPLFVGFLLAFWSCPRLLRGRNFANSCCVREFLARHCRGPPGSSGASRAAQISRLGNKPLREERGRPTAVRNPFSGLSQEPRPRLRPVGSHYCGLSCQRTIYSDTARPARTRFTFALICKGCSRKPRNGRCRGLSACCRTSSSITSAHARKNCFHALHSRPKARPGRRHVAALL